MRGRAILLLAFMIALLAGSVSCELGAPVYVANWGSSSANGSTPLTPLASLQAAVRVSNNVVVMSDLSGAQQCLNTIPVEYDQLSIQPSGAFTPTIQLLHCAGPFLLAVSGPVEIRLQSLSLVCGSSTNGPMISLLGDEVVLRAEGVRFTGAQLSTVSGWLSVEEGASAYLNNCTIANNQYDIFPLVQTTGSGRVFFSGSSLSDNSNYGGHCLGLPFPSICVPEVVIYEGGSAVFTDCLSSVTSLGQHLYAGSNTTVQLIDSAEMFYAIQSHGNVTITLGNFSDFQLYYFLNSSLTFLPSPRDPAARQIPSVEVVLSTVYLPDVAGMFSTGYNGLRITDSEVHGRGRVLSLSSLSAGNVAFYDCPIEASSSTLGYKQSYYSPPYSTISFKGAKGPSGADLVARFCEIDNAAQVDANLTSLGLRVVVPTMSNSGPPISPAFVRTFSGTPNSTLGVFVEAYLGRKSKDVTIPAITFGSASPPKSHVSISVGYKLTLDKYTWSRSGNSTTLKVKVHYNPNQADNSLAVVLVVSVLVMLTVIGFAIWGCIACAKRCAAPPPTQPSYMAVTNPSGSVALYESI